ncbi:kinase-like domain-containing protein [Suillus bovinus]|uniref:kinase-like domain-containing protein n=1 Tax=Suillus bovinus TaxID=48563 RepID=UPI001B871EE8|nr:kinase-like domain-containing protein [Suillus bovinus]KAG2155817.1 kinase-like domain-containing protein [Suillus bovinus]
MLPGDQLRLGPKVALNVITPTSLSAPRLSTALPNVPGIRPLPIPTISNIAGDINTAERTLNYPDSVRPPHPEPANPPGLAKPSTSRLPRRSYVNGPFRVWRGLSAGGFATTVAAEDVASGRSLCLKVFRKDRLQYTGRSLRRELEVYKRLASEYRPANIFLMELEMAFQTRKDIYLVMDLMAYDLTYYMRNESEYCIENARRWSAQLALGINALHDMGIIHRDIKAENVLIDIQQNVRITDFGLGYYIKEPRPLNPWRGYTSSVKGTIHCMAPEILRNMENPNSMKYGVPVDWWAFGCVLYQLISLDHKVLFDSENATLEYVSWRSEHYGTLDLFPAFDQLDSLAADLLVRLLHPIVQLRYGFRHVTTHSYFLNDDGTMEFDGAYSSAVKREKWPQMLPSLRNEKTSDETANVLCCIPPGSSGYVPNVDWRKPRPQATHFP